MLGKATPIVGVIFVRDIPALYRVNVCSNANRAAVKRRFLWLFAALVLVGCRDVRVLTVTQGTTPLSGPNAVVVVRSARDLEQLGIRSIDLRLHHEFGVVLLMGPHRSTNFHQVIESIKASGNRIRVVAFEQSPPDGGEPRPSFRTYTLWIVPTSVYRPGLIVEVVSPDGVTIATTVLH
jgi:hypothetical protein